MRSLPLLRPSHTAIRALILGLATATLPALLQAQAITIAGDLVFAKPYGEFGHNVKQGWGLSTTGILAKPGRPLALRLDISYLNYGSQTRRSWFDAIFGSYAIDKTTTNNIISVGIGPQLMVPVGSFRPYVNVQGGVSHYFTQTWLEGINSDFFETSRTESSNLKLSYGAGAGAMIPIVEGTRTITLNVGAQYYVSGRTSYLTREDIHPDEQTGRIPFTPRTTDVRYISYRLGLTVTF